MLKARVEDLAESLLQTDLDAIAADHDHVVFTVRVSRRFLRENHGFLAAVSDFASGSDLPPRQNPSVPSAAPPARPAMGRVWTTIATLVVIAFVVGLSLPQVHFAQALAHQHGTGSIGKP